MKYGKCCECTNIKYVKNRYYCKKHNKEINKDDIVICAFYNKNVE
ncbi:hypothetical protein OSC52_11855 [Clostridium pasteurianum]|nr:hypothetical protein [Clostridium pasteurianum]UZW12549.1 hypothetical protein OSC52_11855 [Clostridium pasteurianum]